MMFLVVVFDIYMAGGGGYWILLMVFLVVLDIYMAGGGGGIGYY